jgi:hypothetical protein
MVVREEEVMASSPAGAPTHTRPEPPRGSRPDGAAQENLDWEAFSARFFPGRRRHDLEAFTAYAAYRHDLEAAPHTTARQRAARG